MSVTKKLHFICENSDGLLQCSAMPIFNKKNGCSLIKANDDATRQLIYSLRYQVYRNIGAVDIDPSERFVDEYDDYSNSFPYLYLMGEKPVGSIRTCIYSKKFEWQNVPAHKMFAQEIKNELGENCSLVETTRLVIEPSFQSFSSGHFFNLFCAPILMNKLYQPDYMIGTIVPEHVRFYKRFFQFQPISIPKAVPGLNVPSSVLVAVKGSLFNEICDQKK